jgi:hypothetical protein
MFMMGRRNYCAIGVYKVENPTVQEAYRQEARKQGVSMEEVCLRSELSIVPNLLDLKVL